MARERYVYALSVWTVEKRARGWYYARAASQHDAADWKGPYSSLASVSMMLGRELRREIRVRYERQANGNGAAAAPAAPQPIGVEP